MEIYKKKILPIGEYKQICFNQEIMIFHLSNAQWLKAWTPYYR